MVDVAEQAFEAGLVELAVMQESYNKELAYFLDHLLSFGFVAAFRPPGQVWQHPLLIEVPQFVELLLFSQHIGGQLEEVECSECDAPFGEALEDVEQIILPHLKVHQPSGHSAPLNGGG